MQSLPAHPIDSVLNRYDWKRATLADVGGESSKLAARIICQTVALRPGTRPVMAAIDVHMWKDGESVKLELANVNLPPQLRAMFEVLITQGLKGLPPRALGLTPCRHEPWHWESMCLTLVWRREMDDYARFRLFTTRYARLLEDKSWQCPDAVQMTRRT